MRKIPGSLLAHAWNDPSQTIDDVLKGVYFIVEHDHAGLRIPLSLLGTFKKWRSTRSRERHD
ncbi:hypothetical protein EV14_2826 [Prochlorococcus sp. MIT 0703]|nr:hypothetical protein EV12_2660 [Prochlorococcus sp. MIT 0701]KGG30887.1 hypothetical protein EV14_2826 [Prochlorococcus sp. MIT 0703]